MVARVFLLPPAGEAVETRLIVTPAGNGERWLRTFGTRALNTRQYPAGDHGVAERIGPLEFRFQREPCDDGTRFRQIHAAIVIGPVRVRLPRWCAPTVAAREDPAGERRVHIDVRVSLPLVGPILSYAGTIDLDEPSERAQRREPRERSAPAPFDFAQSAVSNSRTAKRRARERIGESEGRSLSDKK